MGLHLGEAEERDGDYFGPVVSTAARVAAAGHGGQVLVTEAVRAVAEVDVVDLGVHGLRDIERPLRIYQLGNDEFPPLRVVDPAMSNLPVRSTRLIGREDETAALRQLLAEHRWVTVTGVGGLGKTRLAIAVGEAELLHRRDGVWFVDLTAVGGANEVPAATAKALGLTLRGGDPIEQVIGFLGDKAALVIVDNCEHVIDAIAEFAQRFLTCSGAAVVLATSREALGIDGERIVGLEPLPSGGPDAPAVRLFAERAVAVDPGFVLSGKYSDVVAALCAHLDGMPLAIELAAARASVMTPRELLEGLADRFELLSDGRRRQRRRTLEATLDWSYDLLAPGEQDALRALGAFVDGFDVDAVAAVAGTARLAAMTIVEGLVAKSLVVPVRGGDHARFRLLETVKAYAERRLADAGEASSVHDRHFDHFYGLATKRGCSGFSELRLGIGLRADRGNLTGAFERAAAGENWVKAAELIAGSYAAFLIDGGLLDAATLIDRAIQACDDAALVDALHVALVHCLVWLNEWSTIGRIAESLVGSSVPPLRAFGFLLIALIQGFSDSDGARDTLSHAQAQVDACRATSPSLTADIVAGYVPWIGARISASAGDYESALAGVEAWLAVQTVTDFFSTGAARAMKQAAVCEILLGRPRAAFGAIEWFDQFDFVGSNTDDVQALAHLALGETAAAERRIRVHAARALTGRLVGEVCDTAMLFAALAHAEGEDDIARDLLLQMGMGQEPATIVYSAYLATTLGIAAERTGQQEQAMGYDSRSVEGPSGSRMAMAAVRNELHRRGWD
jgi:predicted ATPase